MQMVFNTSSSNEHYNGDCDCAVVDVTPQLIETLRQYCEVAKRAYQESKTSLWSLRFWGSPAEFYPYGLVMDCEAVDEEFLGGFESEAAAPLPEGVSVDDVDPRRVDCDQTVIMCESQDSFRVKWQSNLKHQNITVETYSTTLDWLEECLQQEGVRS